MNESPAGHQRQATQDLFGGSLASDAAARPRMLADFERQHELGRGGNAAVYIARCTTTGQRVALKVIHADADDDPKYLARFHREVSNATRLVHPNVCRVHAFGAEGDVLWLAMELIEG
ncbi:MAG TPA: protein kinase, partial [Myxococcota bacterium]